MYQVRQHKPNNKFLLDSFLQRKSLFSLAAFLRVKPEVFQDALNNPIYKTKRIPKKKGGSRELTIPQQELMEIQQQLNFYFQLYYIKIVPSCAHGFVLNTRDGSSLKNIVSNAKAHVGKAYVFNVDLKDFFSSIDAKRVHHVLNRQLNLFNSEEITAGISLLCTYNGFLPTGAPTSPVISNLVCLGMDYELEKYCVEKEIVYTRYADDLSFSSDTYFNEYTIQEVQQIIEKHKFEINRKKIRLNSSRSKQRVTGLIVNEKVNVERTYIKKVRACLHSWKMKGLEFTTAKHFNIISPSVDDQRHFANKLKGQIEFIGQVRGNEDKIYEKYINEFKVLKS